MNAKNSRHYDVCLSSSIHVALWNNSSNIYRTLVTPTLTQNHGIIGLTLATFSTPIISFIGKFIFTPKKFCPMSQLEFRQNIPI